MTALHPSGSEGPRTPCRSCGRSGPRHGAGGGGGFLEGLWDGVRGWCCKGPPETGGRKDGVLQSLPPQAGSRLSSQALELPGWLGPRTGPAQRPGATTPSPPQVESSFGHYRQFLMQASAYLRSPHRNLRLAAMKFIGGCSRPRAH